MQIETVLKNTISNMDRAVGIACRRVGMDDKDMATWWDTISIALPSFLPPLWLMLTIPSPYPSLSRSIETELCSCCRRLLAPCWSTLSMTGPDVCRIFTSKSICIGWQHQATPLDCLAVQRIGIKTPNTLLYNCTIIHGQRAFASKPLLPQYAPVSLLM